MNTSVTIQNLGAAVASWLFAEARKRNVSVEALTLDLIRIGIDQEIGRQKKKDYFRRLEQQHAAGYAQFPIQPGEFDEWETEQVWENE